MTISDETMNIYQQPWHYLGLWSLPSQGRHPWYTAYSILVNFTGLIVFNVCILLSLFVANCLDDIAETALPASSLVAIAVKVFLFITSRRDFSRLMYLMKLLETVSVLSSSERSILLDAKRKSALATTFFIYISIIALSMLLLNTCIQPERSLMWPSWYPFDWQSNLVWYGLALFFQVACTFYLIMMTMSVDMWRVAAFLMLGGFLDVLSGRMQRLGCSGVPIRERSKLVTEENKARRLHEKELIDCVKYHLLCLRCLRLLEKVCKLHYLVQLSISNMMICLLAYLLTTFHPMDDVSKFIWISGGLISCCFQLSIPCYLGSILADKTDQLSFSLYESNWPDMSPAFKSTMIIILEATKEPIYMCTTWNLFTISLPTFVRVVKSAYSMMSFLKGMK